MNISDKVIVVSSIWEKFLANFIKGSKIAVIENFVNFSRFNRLKRKENFSNEIKVLFVGGRGAKQKGLYDTLKAIPIVIKRCKNILFLFVACLGINKLNTIFKKKEIALHTRFLGYIHGDEKIKIFIESDIFILPSYSEGLPITMLEAMAAGLPIIATPVGGIPEILENGKNGFLIKPGDYKTLAKKILILTNNKKLRQKMGKNNLEKIKKQYDREIIFKKLSNIYEILMGNN